MPRRCSWCPWWPSAAGVGGVPVARAATSSRALRRRRSEVDLHARAPPGGVLGLDVAAMRFSRLAHDRQAEARAGQLAGAVGTVEALEHVRQIGLLEAWAGV